jgi:hypothetical protein
MIGQKNRQYGLIVDATLVARLRNIAVALDRQKARSDRWSQRARRAEKECRRLEREKPRAPRDQELFGVITRSGELVTHRNGHALITRSPRSLMIALRALKIERHKVRLARWRIVGSW